MNYQQIQKTLVRGAVPYCFSFRSGAAKPVGVCTFSLADLDSHGAMNWSEAVTAARENWSRATVRPRQPGKATDWLELRWLGMDVGFGIFNIGEHPNSGPLRIGAVADYEFEDPHTVVRVQATKSDRAAGDRTNDYVAVYGPMALVNAACKTHSNVGFKDADIRLSGKQIWLEWMLRTKSVCAGTQLLAAYPATAGHQWLAAMLYDHLQ